jgi:hypothetical protein
MDFLFRLFACQNSKIKKPPELLLRGLVSRKLFLVRSVGGAHGGVTETPIDAYQDLVEVAPDIRRRATYAQVGKEKRFVLRKDVVPLDP